MTNTSANNNPNSTRSEMKSEKGLEKKTDKEMEELDEEELEKIFQNEIKQSKELMKAAQDKAKEYNCKLIREKKTIAAVQAGENVEYTLSGWSDSKLNKKAKEEFRSGNKSRLTDDVLDSQENIEYKCITNKSLDHDEDGRANASHAEKQAAALATEHFDKSVKNQNISIGVNKKMCKDCQDYFKALSAAESGNTYIITDPEGTKIFRKGNMYTIPTTEQERIIDDKI